jgi:hypothetical protein
MMEKAQMATLLVVNVITRELSDLYHTLGPFLFLTCRQIVYHTMLIVMLNANTMRTSSSLDDATLLSAFSTMLWEGRSFSESFSNTL